MLTSFRAGVCALAAAATFLSTSAQADNVSVLIVDGAYFPPLIFANPGDNIIFVNKSQAAHVVSGPDGTWTSGDISPEDSYVLNLTQSTPLTYSGVWIDNEPMSGEISFEN